jgi:Na+-driven multidrug efflux pump
MAVFQGIGSARATTIMSFAQGLLFIPVIILANLLFGLTGIIWAMTATELLTFLTGLVLWVIVRPTRAEPTAEAAAQARELVAA